MSDTTKILEELSTYTMGAIDGSVTKIADDFLTNFKDVLDNGSEVARERVIPYMEQAAHFKMKAMRSQDVAEARKWAESAETSMRRVKTVLLAEGIIVHEKTASFLTRAWDSVVGTIGSVAKVAIGAAANGLAQGAIASLTGGAGGALGTFRSE